MLFGPTGTGPGRQPIGERETPPERQVPIGPLWDLGVGPTLANLHGVSANLEGAIGCRTTFAATDHPICRR